MSCQCTLQNILKTQGLHSRGISTFSETFWLERFTPDPQPPASGNVNFSWTTWTSDLRMTMCEAILSPRPGVDPCFYVSSVHHVFQTKKLKLCLAGKDNKFMRVFVPHHMGSIVLVIIAITVIFTVLRLTYIMGIQFNYRYVIQIQRSSVAAPERGFS